MNQKKKKWREISFSWTAGFSIFRILLLSNLIHTFNAILVKLQASYFVDSKKNDFEVYTEKQNSQNNQHSIEI